jgi:trimeric autotransporter adhesin
MSTKTTFKRIALVAVAALGLGVLSVAPSSAAVSSLALATTAGTNGNVDTSVIDTATAARVTVTALTTEALDSISVTFVRKSAPTLGASSTAKMGFWDTGTATTLVAAHGALGTTLQRTAAAAGRSVTAWDSRTAVSTDAGTGYAVSGAVGFKSATFLITLETGTAHAAGDYVFTVIAQTFKDGVLQTAAPVVQDVTITVAALASASKVVDPSKSSATLSGGAVYAAAAGTDSSVATLATASATVKGVIRVINNNASESAVAESITVTVTGPGVVRANGSTTAGKSVKLVGDGNDDIEILSDGTAGVASIAVSTTSVTYPAKSVTFYAAAAKTITLSVNKPVIAVGASTDVIRATALDANGNVWGGTAYIVAATAADALIAGSSTPVACSFNAGKSRHECPVSGTAKGTANFNVIDASTVALATATSASTAATRVSIGTPATAKIAFDKATYNPGEKALVSVTVLDAEGLVVAAQTVTNAFAADIATSVAFQSGNLTGSASPVIVANTDLTVPQAAGTAHFVVYMPIASGDVTLSATGSTGLAAAGRVAVSATASVVNSSVDAATDAANEATDAANAATDAALAAADAADAATAAAQDASDAVAALSASVSKLISSLRAQITSLTNLVIKIQKKVRA